MKYILCTLGVFFSDFILKRKVDGSIKQSEEKLICKEKIILTKYYNKGAMLNFLQRFPRAMLAIHAAILSVMTGVYAFALRTRQHPGLKLGLALMVGGGLSNLHDRFTKHHVVDYFRFNVPVKKLRNIIFNISDIFVFLGGILVILFGSRK